VQSVALVRIRELDAGGAGVDAHAQVDVTLAHFDEVHAGPHGARDRLRLLTLHVDFGRILDERLGPEASGTAGEQQARHGRGCGPRQRRRILLIVVPRPAHPDPSPRLLTPMFTGTCDASQCNREKVGRVCSKSLIEKTLWL
jgi:hypothetical protein